MVGAAGWVTRRPVGGGWVGAVGDAVPSGGLALDGEAAADHAEFSLASEIEEEIVLPITRFDVAAPGEPAPALKRDADGLHLCTAHDVRDVRPPLVPCEVKCEALRRPRNLLKEEVAPGHRFALHCAVVVEGWDEHNPIT